MSNKIKKKCSCGKEWYCAGTCNFMPSSLKRGCWCVECFFIYPIKKNRTITQEVITMRRQLFPERYSDDKILQQCYGKDWKKKYILIKLCR